MKFLLRTRVPLSANRRVQYTETEKETENIPPLKKEKEKESGVVATGPTDEEIRAVARAAVDATLNPMPKVPATDGYEERIHKIVMRYRFREGSLDYWTGSTMEEKKLDLIKHLVWLLDDADSEAAETVGGYLKIPDYKAQWRDIVMAYVKVLNATGYISKLVNSDKINLYLDIFAKKSDPDADTLQEGIQIKDELEKIRKAKIAVEKQRFPFEDYDPERGTRYVGNRLIPWDAPPRPDNHSVWDEDDNKWVDPEVLDARRAAGFARLEAMMAEMPLMTSSRLKSLSPKASPQPSPEGKGEGSLTPTLP